ncbi:hypothetical protein ACE939_04430 [Aquimarina sp. W85]|uniref:hypothetical protein n=1 Tax=Aquimarina rhodophyticola TaxID=3342246 RepID=UPI003672A653
MKNSNIHTSLSIEKFQIAKLDTLSSIRGGNLLYDEEVIGTQTDKNIVKSSLPCIFGGDK